MKIITRTVWILSIVSLFADVASEMLYPVIPIYLQEIGFSILWIGILEGLANFTSGISKGYFGKLSDDTGKRLPFVKLGYFLSALSKPMLAMTTWPLWIFFARTLDRLGKGVRTAARDAILSNEATIATKARVFTFHRGWDTTGAFLGPLVSLAVLHYYPFSYRTIFYLAFIPGSISVALIFLLKERHQAEPQGSSGKFFSYFRYWNTATDSYRKLVVGLLILALFNSSDVFLLLRIKQITGSDFHVIGAYVFYNLIYAVSSYPMGILADRVGIRKIFIVGVVFFAITYCGFAAANQTWMCYALFLIYGVYAAATEGIAKAWITNLAGAQRAATAIGFYTSFESICTLLASFIAGAIWSAFGAAATFVLTAVAAIVTIVYLSLMRIRYA